MCDPNISADNAKKIKNKLPDLLRSNAFKSYVKKRSGTLDRQRIVFHSKRPSTTALSARPRDYPHRFGPAKSFQNAALCIKHDRRLKPFTIQSCFWADRPVKVRFRHWASIISHSMHSRLSTGFVKLTAGPGTLEPNPASTNWQGRRWTECKLCTAKRTIQI